jgi:hypothetical protein
MYQVSPEEGESTMITLTPYLEKAIEIAAVCVEREFQVRRRIDPQIPPEELSASVTLDGRIAIGHRVLQSGQGFYVNNLGEWREV